MQNKKGNSQLDKAMQDIGEQPAQDAPDKVPKNKGYNGPKLPNKAGKNGNNGGLGNRLANAVSNKSTNAVDSVKNAAQQGKRIVKNGGSIVRHTATVVATVFTNPITLIVLGVLILSLVIFSGMSVLGPSNFGSNCSESGAADGTSVPASEIELAQMKTSSNFGISDEQAAEFAMKGHSDRIDEYHMSKSDVLEANKIITKAGMSPAFFWGYEANEGNNHGKDGWLNHFGYRTDNWKDDLQKTLDAIMPYSKKWEKWCENDGLHVGPKADEMRKLIKEGTIGMLYVQQTSAAAAAFTGGSLSAHGNTYSDPMKDLISWLKKMGGTVNGGSGSTVEAGSSDGDVSSCSSDSDPASTSDILKFALSIAWPAAQHTNDKVAGSCTINSCGKNQSTAAYIKAKEKAMASTPDGFRDLYASCDRFVATVYKNTVDKDMPWGDADGIRQYVMKSSKYKEINCKNIKPGDIVFGEKSANTSAGHVMIYEKPGYIVSASYLDRSGSEHSVGSTGCNGNGLSNADSWAYGQIFRFVVTPNPVK